MDLLKKMSNKNKVMILGSNSFAANSCANYLLNRNFKVSGVARPRKLHARFDAISNFKNFTYYQIDLNTNLNKLLALIDKIKPDYIIDFAAQGMVAESWNHPEYWFETNILTKVKLHKFLSSKKFLLKYINISTPEVYGNCNGKLKTSNFMNPSTPYAVSKASTDMSLNTFFQQYGFPVVTGRFANFFGPYQTLYRIVPLSIHKAFNKQTIDLHGGGLSKRFFIYSDDFLEGILKLLIKGEPGKTYHFSADQMISIKNLVRTIYTKLDLNYKNYVNVTPNRPGIDFIYDLDDLKSRKELNWSNKFSLEEGIDKTIDWYLKFQNQFTKNDETFKVKK